MLCDLYCLKTRLRLLCNKDQRHSSLNLVSQLLKLCNIFIFGMTYCPRFWLTLRIPSYFGPTLYTRGGLLSGPPTISSTLSYTNVKFCKVLEIPFKVSENKRLVKNLLYGYHGNCLMTWCFSLIIVKMLMKNG